MDGGQGQLEEQAWSHAGYPSGTQAFRTSDVVTVLSGLRDEVERLEGEIQRVEGELLSDPDNKVLNRKFERLTEEKRNKEARRERLELHLTNVPQEQVYVQTSQAAPGLLQVAQEMQVPPQPHPYYHVPQAGVKRTRDDGQPEFHNPNLPEYLQGVPEGLSHSPQPARKGQGRGGKGGQKFCKRCKERITYGHQQKCKYCRKCYDDNKQLVLRTACPHGHEPLPPQPQMMLGGGAMEPHQALEAQQHPHVQIQLHQAPLQGQIHPSVHHLHHHLSLQQHPVPEVPHLHQEGDLRHQAALAQHQALQQAVSHAEQRGRPEQPKEDPANGCDSSAVAGSVRAVETATS